ncbi:speckle targeted PIP5K1A-regulated poly(A) polymerase [Lasioglossum baleicum]|uniref:speckle targeted PIP5K1A-regulated poly(A) polymerase n=1 Tax=Lasioglossum baleicum TaxID=434251 RepID=UPI003FCE441C
MMSNQCELCSIEFQDEHALQGHLGGKKHLQKVQLLEGVKKSIFVSSLPQFIPPPIILEFFQQYGAIKWHNFKQNNLIIEFVERSSTEAVLSKPLWINNVRLNVQRRIFHNNLKIPKLMKQSSPIENTGTINYYNIQHIFEEESTFDEQLATFLNAIQLSEADIERKYEIVCTQLDKIFKQTFPNCKTYKFGSTQTGLGFKECDLDIYMDIGERISESTNTSADTWTMNKILKEVKRIMYRMNHIFSNIISIPKARTPIIKFCYVKTNISCDISFKNSSGIYKSKLIKHCISLDCRLKPLMMLIKYWARNFKLSSSGKISNYALAFLIIFYLQQPSVNIIPPLLEFQKNCQPHVINGWQVNFDENTKLPPITNTSSIPQLLYGFFIFYSTFTFKSNVICPLDGKVHTELEFNDVENLPHYMDRYKVCAVKDDENCKFKVNRPMCVQDPIELNYNITANTPHSTFDAFVQYCTIGAAVCTEASKNDYKDLLKILLSTVRKEKFSGHTFKVTISANKQKCVNVTKKTKLTNNDWHSAVYNIVTSIFEKVFKVQVVALTSDVEAKQQKTEVLSDVHTEEYQKIVFHCTGSLCTWSNRKVSNIILDPSLSCLEKEAFITNETIKANEKEKSANRINLDFMCTFEKKANPLRVILTVSNRNTYESIFQGFAYFAEHKILEIVRQTLTHMQQFNKFN